MLREENGLNFDSGNIQSKLSGQLANETPGNNNPASRPLLLVSVLNYQQLKRLKI